MKAFFGPKSGTIEPPRGSGQGPVCSLYADRASHYWKMP